LLEKNYRDLIKKENEKHQQQQRQDDKRDNKTSMSILKQYANQCEWFREKSAEKDNKSADEIEVSKNKEEAIR
jgi:hypothetical protein